MKGLNRLLALFLCFALLTPCLARAEAADNWVTFFLMCNEGMQNESGDVGNTMMIISMNPANGRIKQLMFTWDTFINYPGYETPQLLDQPFRIGGPEETIRLFNENFSQSVSSYLSVNFLNLASLIDFYGGVQVDVTRAERNALNGLVASKEKSIQAKLKSLYLDENMFADLFKSYYLEDYGLSVHLSGMQAVAYGWLQYDSVGQCCRREVDVIAQLFQHVGSYVDSHAVFYENGEEVPTNTDGRRIVNLDALTDDDHDFLNQMVSPIFDKTYHNLTPEQIDEIGLSLVRAAYEVKRNNGDLFGSIEYKILPLESDEKYVVIAGAEGHTVDYAANARAINAFLFDKEK